MQSLQNMNETPVRICLVVFSGINREVLKGVQRAFLAEDRLARLLQDHTGCETRPDIRIEIRSATTKPVTCDQSRQIVPTCSGWDGAENIDLIVLVTGPDPLAYLPMGLRGLLLFADRAGATLAAVGTGAAVLEHLHYLARTVTERGKANTGLTGSGNADPVVQDRRIVVPANALHQLADLFAKNHAAPAQSDPPIAAKRPNQMPLSAILSDQKAQQDAPIDIIPDPASPVSEQQTEEADDMRFMNTDELSPPRPYAALETDPVLSKMRAVMADSIDAPLPLTEIAEKMDLSPKQLRLRCKKVLGTTPAQAYLALRLDHARELVNATALPVGDIATCTGFASASAFTRSYKRVFGHSPREARSL